MLWLTGLFRLAAGASFRFKKSIKIYLTSFCLIPQAVLPAVALYKEGAVVMASNEMPFVINLRFFKYERDSQVICHITMRFSVLRSS